MGSSRMRQGGGERNQLGVWVVLLGRNRVGSHDE